MVSSLDTLNPVRPVNEGKAALRRRLARSWCFAVAASSYNRAYNKQTPRRLDDLVERVQAEWVRLLPEDATLFEAEDGPRRDGPMRLMAELPSLVGVPAGSELDPVSYAVAWEAGLLLEECKAEVVE